MRRALLVVLLLNATAPAWAQWHLDHSVDHAVSAADMDHWRSHHASVPVAQDADHQWLLPNPAEPPGGRCIATYAWTTVDVDGVQAPGFWRLISVTTGSRHGETTIGAQLFLRMDAVQGWFGDNAWIVAWVLFLVAGALVLVMIARSDRPKPISRVGDRAIVEELFNRIVGGRYGRHR